MADTQNTSTLPTATGSGTQGTTQDPQTAQQSSGTTNQVSNVQPSAPNTLLANTNGIPLQPTNVTSVNLDSSTATTTAPAVQAVHHHTNGPLLGFSGVLFVIAIALFWSTSRSAKNTTK